MFGIPSGPVLPLIEALGRSPVEFVLTANETSAGFMATTVGQLTGVPGACAATVGPGATNLTTGVGCAWLDCAPVLAFTCNVSSPWLERRIQMRIDHNALFRPLTKATFALGVDDVADRMAEAVALAKAEPPGPVHLDCPRTWGGGSVGEALAPASATGAGDVAGETRGPSPSLSRPAAAGDHRLTFTRCAATDSCCAFERHQVRRLDLHAKGFLPESHPNWAGVIGQRRPHRRPAEMLDRADLIIAVG